MEKNFRFNLLYFIFAWLAIILFQNWWKSTQEVETIPYNQFEAYLEQGQIEDVEISDRSIRGSFTESAAREKTRFVTNRVPQELVDRLSDAGVEYRAVIPNTIIRDILSWIFPMALFIGIWMFLFRRITQNQGTGGFMAIGKSSAKIYMEKDTRVTFDDVAGVDEAITELEEIIEFLKTPDQYGRLGAHVPKGVLLVGPPGTGKTLLARAVAGEAGVPFFSISGSEFVEMFVGVGAARVRDLFEQARKSAPAIIFIDELDALGRARGAFPGVGGHDEREQTLNQLLAELDGFDPSYGLVLLAATNRPEILDPALMRAGRFDRQILVDRPDKLGRVQILDVHLKKVTLADDVDPEKIAALTTGFSGADLANLVNEAALLATRRHAHAATLDDFTNAIERIITGLEKRNRLLNPREREVVANHEMGHAVVSLALPGTDKVHKVSIVPRGIGALGYTMQRPTEDRYLMSSEELNNKIAVLLGGRAAESLVFEELSTGAADDLVKATNIARSMVMRYGMDEDLGYVAYDTETASYLGTESMFKKQEYSEETSREIDIAVRNIIRENFERAVELLDSNREILGACVKVLLDKETLAEEELLEMAAGLKDPHENKREGDNVMPVSPRESSA